MNSAPKIDRKVSIWKLLPERNIYIWGAGQQGRGIAKMLDRTGYSIRGFVDASTRLQGQTALGLPIYGPDLLSGEIGAGVRPYIIIASFFFEEEIRRNCLSLGLMEGSDFVTYKELKPFDYAVDISGVCNLRCISCPRAARHESHPPAGFMDAGTFETVLNKILREDPLVASLQLYQWGEPLLNPHLPEILRIAGGRGIQCALSSNLNVKCDLAPVIEAGPAWFRISVSGCGEDYEKTHTGANWPLMLANMEELARLKSFLGSDMKAEVYYHIYRHNQGESMDRVRNICDRLGFEFHPVWAYLISLDDVLEYLEGGDLSPQAKEAAGMLALNLEQGLALARQEADRECLVDRCIHINWDLTVSHCMMFFYPRSNIAARNFLETPLADIQRARKACELCHRCRTQALHRYCSVYSTELVCADRGKP